MAVGRHNHCAGYDISFLAHDLVGHLEVNAAAGDNPIQHAGRYGRPGVRCRDRPGKSQWNAALQSPGSWHTWQDSVYPGTWDNVEYMYDSRGYTGSSGAVLRSLNRSRLHLPSPIYLARCGPRCTPPGLDYVVSYCLAPQTCVRQEEINCT